MSINLSDSTPSAPSGHTNVAWQKDGSGNVSANIATPPLATRTISTTAPLAGGGDLSADRTLAISNFTGDAGSGGAKGAVPAPASGDAAAGKFLSADGSWGVPAGGVPTSRTISTTAPLTGGGDLSANRTLAISSFTGDAGSGGAKGAVPAPASGDAAAGKFLAADGGWSVPPGGVPTARTISTTAPLTGGGDLSANRTLAISDFTGDAGSGGAKGSVPAPASGDTAAGKFLKADGSWAVPPGTTSGTVTHTGGLTANLPVIGNTSGDIKIGTAIQLVPSVPSDATQFLNGAATPAFAQVKDSDLSTSDITTNNVSTSKHGFVPKLPDDSSRFLDGTGGFSVPVSGVGSTAPSLVQSATATATGATATATFGSTPTVGNLLVFFVGGRGSGAGWTPPTNTVQLSSLTVSFQRIDVYIRVVQSGDGTGWGFNTTSDPIDVWAGEFANAGFIDVKSSSCGNPPTSGATQSGAFGQTLRPPSLVYAAFEADGATSAVAGTDYTFDAYLQVVGSNHPMVIMHKTTSPTAPGFVTTPPTITWTGVATGQNVLSACAVISAL